MGFAFTSGNSIEQYALHEWYVLYNILHTVTDISSIGAEKKTDSCDDKTLNDHIHIDSYFCFNFAIYISH